jgi:hypothetical protein
MSHYFSLRTLGAAALVMAPALGCSSTPAGVAALAGRYELRTVDGRPVPVDALGGALAGELQLSADGRVTRVVQYATSGVPGPIVNRATGTYRVHGSQVTLSLAEEGRTARLARWQVRGEVRLPTLVLRYPRPGEWMVEELYVRVPVLGGG